MQFRYSCANLSAVIGSGLPPVDGSSNACCAERARVLVAHAQIGQRVRNADRAGATPGSTPARRRTNACGRPRKAASRAILSSMRAAIPREHVRHDDGVGQPVMRVEIRRARMAQAVHRAEAFLERGRAHRRRDHHVRARFDVAAVAHGDRQPFLDQAACLRRAMPSAIGW